MGICGNTTIFALKFKFSIKTRGESSQMTSRQKINNYLPKMLYVESISPTFMYKSAKYKHTLFGVKGPFSFSRKIIPSSISGHNQNLRSTFMLYIVHQKEQHKPTVGPKAVHKIMVKLALQRVYFQSCQVRAMYEVYGKTTGNLVFEWERPRSQVD